ncbi:MAG: DUF6056 family protein [Muribaculum sp.]|nr:DUF6056 family protein [Muribaculum sp.]
MGRYGRIWIFIIIAMIGVSWTVASIGQQLMGDDLGFWGLHESKKSDILHFARFCWGNWMSNNGRLGDMLNYPVLYLAPDWLRAIACGFMMSLFYLLPLKLIFNGRNGVAAAASFCILLILTTFCWWDSIVLFVCQVNYVWAAVFGMATVWAWLRNKGPAWFWTIVAFLAGGIHEAMGAPLCCALLLHLWLNRSSYRNKGLGATRKWIIVGIAAGTLITIVSPGIWLRFMNRSVLNEPDDPSWLILLKSDFYSLALLVWMAVYAIANPKRFLQRLRSEWGIYALISLLSMAVSAVSGIVGRSGWFAQTFAFIAWAQLLSKPYPTDKISKIRKYIRGVAAALCGMTVIFISVGSAWWQFRLWNETRTVYRIYSENPASPVYFDITRETDLPFWTRRSVRGVPDEDDVYLLTVIRDVKGDSVHSPVILPASVRNISFGRVSLPLKVRDGEIYENTTGVTTNTPIPNSSPEKIGVPFEKDGKKLLYIVERDRDPGDR